MPRRSSHPGPPEVGRGARALRRLRGAYGLIRNAYRLFLRVPVDIRLVLLALLLLAIGWPTIGVSHEAPTWALPALGLMEVAPLTMLRRWPFYAWLVAIAGSVVWWLLLPVVPGFPMPWPVVQFLVLLVSLLVVAMLARLGEVGIAGVGTGALFLVAMPQDLIGWVSGQGLIVVFGLLVRWLVLSRRQLAEESETVDVERARRAMLEERSRIARELHDVVAHHMSMVVVQAQSAPVRLSEVSEDVRAELASIEESARQALTEVRGVLGVLRQEEEPSETAPQPGLEQLPDLLQATRAAGVEITWRIDLEPQDCPQGSALVLYRVLQESLANATRHAPGAAITVTLERTDQDATLLVENGPAASSPEPSSDGASGGSGTEGMRTRVEAVGGRMTTAGDAEEGFRVEAVVPLQGRPQVGA